MTLEPSQLEICIKVEKLIRSHRNLTSNRKIVPKKSQDELNNLTSKLERDPFLTIQLRQSTIDSIRDFTTLGNHGVLGSAGTWDETIIKILKLAESKINIRTT